MIRHVATVFAWTVLSTAAIVGSGVTFNYVWSKRPVPVAVIGSKTSVIAASETLVSPLGEVKGVQTTIDTEDARIQLVKNFLKRYDSPLDPEEYGPKLVSIADKYEIDFRLLPAIAMQESNLCKKIPPGSYNCLGFGVHERGTLAFETYEANFDRAARELKKNYIDRGLTTPQDIQRKYTPSSNGSWAASVNQWMAEMRYDDRGKGRDLKTNADVLEFATDSTPSAQ